MLSSRQRVEIKCVKRKIMVDDGNSRKFAREAKTFNQTFSEEGRRIKIV